MATYRGEATLVHRGEEMARVQADLVSHREPNGVRSWRGTLIGDDLDPFDVTEAGTMTIRLPDGREGTVLADHASSVGPGEPVTVRGSGTPPF